MHPVHVVGSIILILHNQSPAIVSLPRPSSPISPGGVELLQCEQSAGQKGFVQRHPEGSVCLCIGPLGRHVG